MSLDFALPPKLLSECVAKIYEAAEIPNRVADPRSVLAKGSSSDSNADVVILTNVENQEGTSVARILGMQLADIAQVVTTAGGHRDISLRKKLRA